MFQEAFGFSRRIFPCAGNNQFASRLACMFGEIRARAVPMMCNAFFHKVCKSQVVPRMFEGWVKVQQVTRRHVYFSNLLKSSRAQYTVSPLSNLT